MRGIRSLLLVATVVALALALVPGIGFAEPDCAQATHDDVPGPLCAELVAPTTTYKVLDYGHLADDPGSDLTVHWEETTVSCGTFTPSDSPTGLSVSAEWSHPNGTGEGSCPHAGSSHPGTIAASIWHSYSSTGLNAKVPAKNWLCTYEGSEGASGGTPGPPCTDPSATPQCLTSVHQAAVNAGGSKVQISGQGSDIKIEFPNGEAPPCTAPKSDTDSVAVLGEAGAVDDIAVKLEMLWDQHGHAIGINGQGGGDSLTIEGAVGTDVINIAGIPPDTIFPDGGITIDVNGDGVPDIGLVGPAQININTGDGNDRVNFDVDAFLKQFLDQGSSVNIDGGVGIDNLDVAAGFSDEYRIFMGIRLDARSAQESAGPPAQVNLNAGDDEIVDITGMGVEEWSVTVADGNDTVSGQGGAGTGGPFDLPLALHGGGGKDVLTGGNAADSVYGDAGNDTLKGKKGKDLMDGGKGTDTCTGNNKDTFKRCE
jgi:hypothetical protein